jgi:hypothetical protein
MKADDRPENISLMMRNMFMYLMENGYKPVYEDGYIRVEVDGNMSVLEYEDRVLTLRTFFTIDEEGYEMFLEASNLAMFKSFMVKPVVMADMKSIMFSCETFCMTIGDFRRFFPMMTEFTAKGFEVHRSEMRSLIQATEMLSGKVPATDERVIETGTSRGKPLS